MMAGRVLPRECSRYSGSVAGLTKQTCESTRQSQVRMTWMPLLLGQCKDFQNELTALEHLAQQLSFESCSVIVHFTPKYN